MAHTLRWLVAAALLSAAAGAASQARQLDLRVRPVTEGTISAIREVHGSAASAPNPALTQPVGLPSDLDQGPLVGAVASRSFGGAPSQANWHFGAVGTPEMQARLAQNGYEVTVTMDDGERRTFRERDVQRLGIGQRVTVRSGGLEPFGG